MNENPYDLAVDLLARVGTYLDLVSGANPPSIRYVAPGDSKTIAFDGPSIQVNVDWVGPGQPGVDASGRPTFPQLLTYVQFAVTILRDAATLDDDGQPPPADLIAADAKRQMDDLMLLRQALVDVLSKSRLPGGWLDPGVPAVLGRVTPVGPMGAAMAVVGEIQVTLT